MVGIFKPTIGESVSNPERWSALPKVLGVIDSHETREPLAKFEKIDFCKFLKRRYLGKKPLESFASVCTILETAKTDQHGGEDLLWPECRPD